MKMLKKLLAVVLTGAMALTLFTACGSNAVTEKDIADALNDIFKSEAAALGSDVITFKSRTDERALAKAITELSDAELADQEVVGSIYLPKKAVEILGINEGGVNKKSRFVWYGASYTDGIGAAGQAYMMLTFLGGDALNSTELSGKKPADTRYMGTALRTMTGSDGKPVTLRVIVVTAEAVDED